MKSSIHLFYGIIIGILATLCVGQTFRQANPPASNGIQSVSIVGWRGFADSPIPVQVMADHSK